MSASKRGSTFSFRASITVESVFSAKATKSKSSLSQSFRIEMIPVITGYLYCCLHNKQIT